MQTPSQNSKSNKEEKIVKNIFLFIFIIVFAGLFFIFFMVILFPGSFGASNGVHTGVVTAVEYNSHIIWGANNVYFKTVRESSQEDTYCVNDGYVKNQLIEAQINKKEVTIYFKNNFIMWKWQCNGGESIIYKVE